MDESWKPPLILPSDLVKLAYLPPAAGVALFLPESWWVRICAGLARLTVALRPRKFADLEDAISTAAESMAIVPEIASASMLRLVSNQHLARLQIIASWRRSGWNPEIELHGRRHIDTALEAGHGAILWIQPLVFSELVTKMALFRSGIPVTHLSRFDHGLSRSRIGARLMNWIWTASEVRYLKERLVLYPEDETTALRRLVSELRDNGVVSITVGRQARRVCRLPFMGGDLYLAEGPARLSVKTGAPLLPVFSLRIDRNRYVTQIHPPLLPTADARGAKIVESMLKEYAENLASYVRRAPDQYQWWMRSPL